MIEVEEAYTHCSKAFLRSQLWDPERYVDRAELPSPGALLQVGRRGGRAGHVRRGARRAVRAPRRVLLIEYRFVDCAYALDRWEAGRDLYLESHVPGAAFLGVELSDLSIEGQGRHPLPRDDGFAAAAGRAGIGEGVFVVAYDHGASGGAARLWWLLRHYGHEDVAVLRGGFDAWLGPVRGGEEEIEPREFVPRVREGDTMDAEELAGAARRARAGRRRRARPGALPRRGRADRPGRRPDPRGRELVLRRSRRAPPEIADADEIVVYCGSGITACVDLLALAQAGRPDAKLYPGSWSDWCAPRAPGESGASGTRRSGAAGDDQRRAEQEMAADELRSAEEQHREQNREQRLRRDERADDRDPRAVEGLEQERVRGAPEEPRQDERRSLAPDVGEHPSAPQRDEHERT